MGSKKTRAQANYARRSNRRLRVEVFFLDEDVIMKPTLQEVENALLMALLVPDGILCLAGLMDNLSAHCSPRLIPEWEIPGARGRTPGIRKYLSGNAYLLSRYSTLMRYVRLGTKIREATGLQGDWCISLLHGLEPTCPDGISEESYERLHYLYAELEGLNFKQMEQVLTEARYEQA